MSVATSPIRGWLTAEDAAKILGLDYSLVCRYCRRRKLKAKQVGRQWWIKVRDFERFAAKPRPVGNPTFRRRKKSRGVS
jgi:excisionase family DNA binding protein